MRESKLTGILQNKGTSNHFRLHSSRVDRGCKLISVSMACRKRQLKTAVLRINRVSQQWDSINVPVFPQAPSKGLNFATCNFVTEVDNIKSLSEYKKEQI